jgi:hypothetical protein
MLYGWFKTSIRKTHICVLDPEFPDMDVAQLKACATCTATLDRDQVPSLSRSNGFTYPPYPIHLPSMDCISERLVALWLPFMQIRRLRHQMGGYGIVGQVINAPVDVNNMVTTLPRQLDDNYSFNVHLKRSLIHLQGCIKSTTVKRWLEHINTVFNVHPGNQDFLMTFLLLIYILISLGSVTYFYSVKLNLEY